MAHLNAYLEKGEYEKSLILPSAYYQDWEMILPEEEIDQFDGLGRIKIGKFFRRAVGRPGRMVFKQVGKVVKPLFKTVGTFAKAHPIGLAIGAVAVGAGVAAAARARRRKRAREFALQREREIALQKEQELALQKEREKELALQKQRELALQKEKEEELAVQKEEQLALQRKKELSAIQAKTPMVGSQLIQPTYTPYQKKEASKTGVSLVQPVTIPEQLTPTISQDSEQFNPTIQPGQPIEQPVLIPSKPTEAALIPISSQTMMYILAGGAGLAILYFALKGK